MTDIVEEDHLEYANELRRALAIYRDADDLINVGAYVKGSNPAIDWAISLHDTINEFLVQGVFERYTFHETIEKLKQAVTPKESA